MSLSHTRDLLAERYGRPRWRDLAAERAARTPPVPEAPAETIRRRQLVLDAALRPHRRDERRPGSCTEPGRLTTPVMTTDQEIAVCPRVTVRPGPDRTGEACDE